jgi:hypothetical protein
MLAVRRDSCRGACRRHDRWSTHEQLLRGLAAVLLGDARAEGLQLGEDEGAPVSGRTQVEAATGDGRVVEGRAVATVAAQTNQREGKTVRVHLINNWLDVGFQWRQRRFWLNHEVTGLWRSVTIAGFTAVWWFK